MPPPRAAQFVDGEPQARGWLGVLFRANATFNHMQILRLLFGKHPNRQHFMDRSGGCPDPRHPVRPIRSPKLRQPPCQRPTGRSPKPSLRGLVETTHRAPRALSARGSFCGSPRQKNPAEPGGAQCRDAPKNPPVTAGLHSRPPAAANRRIIPNVVVEPRKRRIGCLALKIRSWHGNEMLSLRISTMSALRPY